MRFAICSAAYPQDPAYVADFLSGVEAAAEHHPGTKLVLAVEHGYTAFDALVLDRRSPVPIRAVRAPGPTTPAGLRKVMVNAVAADDADAIVFADFDDRLLADALALHAEALADADISYGDMELVDAEGRRLGRTFFEGAAVSSRVHDAAPLFERNFMGFTNTAVRRAALAERTTAIPEAATAADWWLFTTLVTKGCRARRAAGSVVRYRQHAGSTLGAAAATTLAQLRTRVSAALVQCRLLPEQPGVAMRLEALCRLLEAIDRGGDRARVALECAAGPGVWFDDVRRACDAVATDAHAVSGTAR